MTLCHILLVAEELSYYKHTHTLSLPLSLAHFFSSRKTCTHSHTHTHCPSTSCLFSLSLIQTDTPTHTHSYSFSFSHTHTHQHCFSHLYTHVHKQTCTYIYFIFASISSSISSENHILIDTWNFILLCWCCIATCRFMQITTQWRWATQSFRKIYLSLYLKGLCVWEGVGDWTELQYIDPHSYGHQRCVFLNLQGCSTGGPGAQLSAECCSLYRISSPMGLVSKLTDLLSSLSYIIVQRPLLLVGVTIALIQPIHSQGYNSDIPWPDAPVIYSGAFPILTAWPGRRSIYNTGQHLSTFWFAKCFYKISLFASLA